jgi:hypothetical protein
MRRTKLEGGERAVTEKRVSDFGNLSWDWTGGLSSAMAALSRGGGAGPAFIVGLLGCDKKREGNRGNDKRSHCSCCGGGTGSAFVVGLLDIENKRGATEGNITRLQPQRS